MNVSELVGEEPIRCQLNDAVPSEGPYSLLEPNDPMRIVWVVKHTKTRFADGRKEDGINNLFELLIYELEIGELPPTRAVRNDHQLGGKPLAQPLHADDLTGFSPIETSERLFPLALVFLIHV